MGPRPRYLWLVAGFLWGAAAVAQPAEYYAENGQIFFIEENANGLVLRSKYPVALFFENGANSRWTVEEDVIYLGRSCDAASDHWGEGTWSWTNSGFGFEFEHREAWFTRQEFPGEFGFECLWNG